jgi:hypothetical protein
MPRLAGSPRTGWVAAAALVVIGGVALVLEFRGIERSTALREHAAANAVEPGDFVAAAARAHRLLLVSDVAGSVAAKRFAADVIERLAHGPGLDAVVIDVDADQQPWIDRYLETDPEDATVLLANPRAVREREGEGRVVLEIYRRVWRLNRKLGATRRIRIVAGDLPGWPPDRPLSPAQSVARHVERDPHLFDAVLTQVLARDARARALIFADGMHVLRARTRIQTGGAAPRDVVPLASRLADRFPREVYTLLVDAPPGRSVVPEVAAFRGTRAFDLLRRAQGLPLRFGVRINDSFGAAGGMIELVAKPGIRVALAEPDAPLAAIADGYIFLGDAR